MTIPAGSSNGSGEPEVMIDINTTPLIDVMLVLLIMLIITIPVQTHAVKLNMPVTKSAPAKLPEIVRIEVDSAGAIFWDGLIVPDRPALEMKLKEITDKAEQPEVHLRPNKLAAYKSVAMVMAAAQRLGVSKIGLAGNEQFADD